MMVADPLREALKQFASVLSPDGINLIVGGGYGLVLPTEQIRSSGARTRFKNPPGARSTADIDLFLGAEIITDSTKMKLIRSRLDDLGYLPIQDFYQFVLPIEYAGLHREIKIDLLAAPPPVAKSARVKQKDRRIRPRGPENFNKLHAHVTPEALTVEENLLPVDVGEEGEPQIVYVPHPFSYLLLKLFALGDRIDDNKKGPYHAFDIYRIIGMTTFNEWEQAIAMRERHRGSEILLKAGNLVNDLFATTESRGVLRLLEHARLSGESVPIEDLGDLIRDLKELLPAL